jgi:hypothetical protein
MPPTVLADVPGVAPMKKVPTIVDQWTPWAIAGVASAASNAAPTDAVVNFLMAFPPAPCAIQVAQVFFSLPANWLAIKVPKSGGSDALSNRPPRLVIVRPSFSQGDALSRGI